MVSAKVNSGVKKAVAATVEELRTHKKPVISKTFKGLSSHGPFLTEQKTGVPHIDAMVLFKHGIPAKKVYEAHLRLIASVLDKHLRAHLPEDYVPGSAHSLAVSYKPAFNKSDPVQHFSFKLKRK